jgi:hypothetical protein
VIAAGRSLEPENLPLASECAVEGVWKIRDNDFDRKDQRTRVRSRRSQMKGIQYLVDDEGNKTAVQIDLKKNARIWEDFNDLALARERRSEPRESLETVKRKLLKKSKSQSNE